MKKRLLSLLLSALLLANVTACNYVPEKETESTIESTTEKVTGESTPKNNIVDPSTLIYYKKFLNSGVKYTKSSPHYLYVEDWDAYIKVPLPENARIFDALIVEDSVCILAIDYASSYLKKTVTTMQITKKGEIVKSNTNDLHLSLPDGSRLFANLNSENCIYIFCLEESPTNSNVDIPQGKSTQDERPYWPIQTYQSTDFGQTWKESELQAGTYTWHSSPKQMTFLSNDVGFFVYHMRHDAYCDSEIFITSNGGKTWDFQFFDFMGDYNEKFFISFQSIISVDNGYIATFIASDKNLETNKTIQYFTSDFQSWMLVEYSK